MSNLLQVTDTSFESDLENAQGTFVLDCWAPWCGPCRAMEPVLEQIDAELSDVTIGKLNVDENPQIAMRYEVLSIPTFLIFKNGNMVKRLTGAMPKAAFIDEINNA